MGNETIPNSFLRYHKSGKGALQASSRIKSGSTGFGDTFAESYTGTSWCILLTDEVSITVSQWPEAINVHGFQISKLDDSPQSPCRR